MTTQPPSSPTMKGLRRCGAPEAPDTIRSAGGLRIPSSIACCASIRSAESAFSTLPPAPAGLPVSSPSAAPRSRAPTSLAIYSAAARERAKAEGLDIDYQVGDAEKLPFADGQFDAVISTCGIMFATRPELAAAEIAQRNPQGRTRDADDVASRQQPLQDVHGDEAIHAAAAHARAALTVRMGQAGARPGTAGVFVRSALRERNLVLSRA